MWTRRFWFGFTLGVICFYTLDLLPACIVCFIGMMVFELVRGIRE